MKKRLRLLAALIILASSILFTSGVAKADELLPNDVTTTLSSEPVTLTPVPQVVADQPLQPISGITPRGISFENIHIKILLSYDFEGLHVYTQLYSKGASPKFSRMNGTCTVKGPSYQSPFSLSQSTTATRTISKYITTGKKFKSGSNVTARSVGTAWGGNIIGGSGSFDLTAKGKVP